MNLYGFLVLMVLGFRCAYSRDGEVNLEIDQVSDDNFKVKTTQIDNVLYKHLVPHIDYTVSKIGQDSTTIWESKDKSECVYVLFAYHKNKVALIALKILHPYYFMNLYYRKVDNSWRTIDIHEYCEAIKEIKRASRIFGEFDLNILDTASSRLYSKEYSTGEFPYSFFSSNIGYLATSVSYDGHRLWRASRYGDRCVAGWAYIKSSYYYMINLLITRYNEESEMQTFFLINNKWTKVHTFYEKTDEKIYLHLPKDFVYPQYSFNLRASPSSVSLDKEIQDNLENMVSQDDYERDLELTSDKVSGSVLNLSDPALNVVGPTTRCVDNVEYKVYSGENVFFKMVVDYSGVVWKAKSSRERCVYAMTPQRNGVTTALYLVIDDSGSFKRLFFDKQASFWFKSNVDKYKNKLEFIKNFVADYDSVLDLWRKDETNEVSVEFKKEPVSYYLHLPKVGFACRKVTNDQKVIWEASSPFDKCVAAWSYETFTDTYYVKLLVTYVDGRSELLSFLNVRKSWERVSSYFSPVFTKGPYEGTDLYNPEYQFNQLEDYSFEKTEEPSEVEESPLQKAETTFERLPSQIDYKPAPVEISPKDCLKLDVSESSESVKYKVETVFDKKLTVVSYYPPPGKYFKIVKEGSNLMFMRLTFEHVCQGVNFYTKQDKLYLGDLLVKVNNHHMTVHYKKGEDKWEVIEQSEFNELVEELKKSV